MKDTPVETIDYKGHKIEIHYDTDAESPRDWDNVGVMVCWHSRYNLGDKHGFESPQAFQEWIKEAEPDAVVLPLYLYDHSGITMSTGSFGDPWDSGQVGYIYVTKKRALEEYGDVGKIWNKKAKTTAEKHLKGEVETYDSFLRGEVYGYNIEGPLSDDSCWGFLGDKDECIAEAKSTVDCAIKHEEDDKAATARAMAL